MNMLINFIENKRINYIPNCDLKEKSWIKRGGKVPIWAEPKTDEQFIALVCFCQQNKVKYDVVGSTSNILFTPEYNMDIIISTIFLNELKIKETEIVCDPGVLMTRLSKVCVQQGIGKYEGFVGLPGTLGGAVVNNSGCFGSLIANVVNKVEIIENCEVRAYKASELGFGHRYSDLKGGNITGVIYKVYLSAESMDNIDVMKNRIQSFQQIRKKREDFKYPSLGTTIASCHYSGYIKLVNVIARSLAKIIYKEQVKQNIFRRNLMVYLNPTKRFREYIAKANFLSFMWKDSGADEAYLAYLRFIERNSSSYSLEINVK